VYGRSHTVSYQFNVQLINAAQFLAWQLAYVQMARVFQGLQENVSLLLMAASGRFSNVLELSVVQLNVQSFSVKPWRYDLVRFELVQLLSAQLIPMASLVDV
jgi:hypothetical protein